MAHLTKSRYVAGLQCLRRLWLIVNEPTEWEEPEPGSIQDVGLEVGRMAHALFPGGVLVDQKPWEHAAAVARTQALMADKSVPAIFEAAFEHDHIRVRVDVLERLRGGWWGLREVKSSSRVKDSYLDDVALQVFVLKGAGVRVSSVELLHINTAYVRGEGGICWPEFFTRADVKSEIGAQLAAVPGHIAEQKACLREIGEPAIEPDGHCWSPYACEFIDRCTAGKPDDWIHYLPKLRSARLTELKTMGIEAISAIPSDFRLTERQTVIREVTITGETYVSPDLPGLLDGFGPPALYLDFEAAQPAIPLYSGTRPFQAIPFQWSLHKLDDGMLTHDEFLASAAEDPRQAFAETLIAAVGKSDLPIVVYSSYEKTQLTALAARFSDLADALKAIIDRLSDLLPVVQVGVYHPDFGFSNSIKSVAPALTVVGYDDLEGISHGSAASAAFIALASGQIDAAEAANIRQSLLAYCERDTLAMVKVHQTLCAMAEC